jgi:hypothetical protein
VRGLRFVDGRSLMLTAEQLLDKINKLRKDYDDDPDDETYQALHHAFLFMSYQIGMLKEYLKNAAEREED